MIRSVLFVAALAAQQSAPPPRAAGPPPRAAGTPPRAAVAVDPVRAVIDAFASHQLVAIADPHGNEQIGAFRLSLIRDPKFAAVVDDIVVEFGSARYQERIDRFVRGEAVADDALREVWQNTTVTGFGWDRPVYEAFFRAVRAVNASHPKSRQLRVLLADPPIDWANVHSADALMNWVKGRDMHAAGVVQREVLAKKRRALIVYGGGHFFRFSPDTLVSLIEKAVPIRVFTVWTDTDTDVPALDRGVAAWPVPSLSIIRGTVLGAIPFTSFVSGMNPNAMSQLRGRRMEDEFDAFLYLGARANLTSSPLSRTLCTDEAYLKMRAGRMSLMPGPRGAPDPAGQLKKECGEMGR